MANTTINDPTLGPLNWVVHDGAWVAAVPVDYFRGSGANLPDIGSGDDEEDEQEDLPVPSGDPEAELFKKASTATGFYDLLAQTDEFKKMMGEVSPTEREQFGQIFEGARNMIRSIEEDTLDPDALFKEGKFKLAFGAAKPKAKPTPAQRAAWEKLTRDSDIFDRMLARVLAVYREQRPVRRKWWEAMYGGDDPVLAQSLPDVKSTAGLRKLIRPIEFRVHPAPNAKTPPAIGIHFDCTWDRAEFGVLLRDGEVVAMGEEDVALQPSAAPEGETIDHPDFGRLRGGRGDWAGVFRFEPMRDFYNIAEQSHQYPDHVRQNLPRNVPPWNFIASEFALAVHGKGAAPPKAAAEAFRAFTADPRRTADVVLGGILDWYRENFEILRQGLSKKVAARLIPRAKSTDDLRHLITFQGLSVFAPGGGKESVVFGLTFDCSWDPEHGLGVRWRDGKVEAVGQADAAHGDAPGGEWEVGELPSWVPQ